MVLAWAFVFVAIAVTSYPKRKVVAGLLQSTISAVLNLILQILYPIKSRDGRHTLPGASYLWPNGNGDAGKFMNGPANSEKWSREYGPVYRIWAGMHPEVVVSRPEDVQNIFKDSDQHNKATNNDSGYLLGEILGQCVGLLSRGEWKRVRTHFEAPFLHKASINYLPQIEQQVETYFSRLSKSSNIENGYLHPVHDMKSFPFLAIARLIYGELSDEQSQDLQELAALREKLWTHAMAGGLSRYSWSRHLPLTANKLLSEFESHWRRFNTATVDRAKALGGNPPILELWVAAETSKINQKELLQTLDETLFANLDVTTSAIAWNLANIASHPTAQQQLYEEILVEKSNPRRGPNSYLLDDETYLAACIKESARVSPIAAFSVPQSVPADKTIGDWVIPKNTNIMVDAYGLNIRNPFWGTDSASYRPSRWKGVKLSGARYNMWRFGFGPRQCMGKYVAEKMLRVVLAHVVEYYELSIDKEGGVGVDPNFWLTMPEVTLRCNRRV